MTLVMKYRNIIGREVEISILERALRSKKSEFVALYGRRRVGKSYLVTEVYSGKIAFTAVGTYIKNGDKDYARYRKLQLEHFYDSLLFAGLDPSRKKPESWREAFVLLRVLLDGLSVKRKVVFIDELPWLAGPQSAELVSELGYFWNSWACSQRNIVLVVCGSATSWMLDNVVHEYGGLHGRLTELFKLNPFTLAECKTYFRRNGFRLSDYEICLTYMAFGGIPYYLDRLRNDQTITENIDRLFFDEEKIHQEFKDVYAGLYSSKDKYISVVKAIGSQFYGMTQAEISAATETKTGGTLSKILKNLLESGVIREYPKYGGDRVENVYQLVDFFSLFYLRFINGKHVQHGMWHSINRTGEFNTWIGNTFELVCILHLGNILKAANIASADRNYCWNGKGPDQRGAQIDLVVESNAGRTDYIFEMKYYSGLYPISAEDADSIENKVNAFSASPMHKTTHSIQLIIVTTKGVANGTHRDAINQVITLEDLFK